ncbi:carbohydrate ABC transporter permease [Celeribacter indicus]|uniref:Binding-protein-dependent transport systems inner membrane component n=1 Tax=Celeribacter indicus TaxID=1208324 RepID=A0A0B5E6V5_9RHOB|nr:sugar ABC transporter permease [Celeribacter indicus]AJE48741.1 binding-protein-dependent transport systems inner membrane component [Celeribacter indicus]SDX11689.1 carbohydrate ABC transporter membrane protein 1, CUT1 family [Celeribacter indicus]
MSRQVQDADERRLARAETLIAAAFLGPWLLGLVVFTLGPILVSLLLAFTDYDLNGMPNWIGLDNFREMFFEDPRFWRSVRATAVYVGFSVPAILVFSLAVAIVLNRGSRMMPVYRVLIYMPSLMGSSVAVAILWRQVFGREGLLNAALAPLGLAGGSWIGSPSTAIYTLIALSVWAFGSTMVIFLAGLRQIPAEYYEAARIDGAGPVRQFFHITLPSLSPVMFFNAIMVTVHCFQAFTPSYVVSQGTGGPVDSTLLYALYLYDKAFRQLDMGYASAMAWLMLAVLAMLTGLFFATSRYWVHYGER